MEENKICLRVSLNDDNYVELYCHPETSLGALHDALHKMKDYVIQKIQEAHQSQEDKKE